MYREAREQWHTVGIFQFQIIDVCSLSYLNNFQSLLEIYYILFLKSNYIRPSQYIKIILDKKKTKNIHTKSDHIYACVYGYSPTLNIWRELVWSHYQEPNFYTKLRLNKIKLNHTTSRSEKNSHLKFNLEVLFQARRT